jgi:tetratricopeptide (TPR) repeat protein
VAMIGYTEHRLGQDDAAIATLRRALTLDADYAEARIYLGNILYDRGEYETALYHLDKTSPEDHWDELGIWRLIELKKSTYRLRDDDPSLTPWDERLNELGEDPDAIDEMLAEIEQNANSEATGEAKGQLELFADLAQEKQSEAAHDVIGRDGQRYEGSWDEIVEQMRAASPQSSRTLIEFMQSEARRGLSITGILISTADAESFVRGSSDAGMLRILR